jgi:hypothetical protein
MYGGRYKFGYNAKRAPVEWCGFTAGLGLCVISALRRDARP